MNNLYIIATTSSESAGSTVSQIFTTEAEAKGHLETIYNQLCSKFAAELSLDVENSHFFNYSFVVRAGERWFQGEIFARKNPFITSDKPVSGFQTAIFEGETAVEIQEKTNAFLMKHPDVEIIDAEISTNLETTPAKHYYHITYAIIYKHKEDKK